jgi:hypothetical protein
MDQPATALGGLDPTDVGLKDIAVDETSAKQRPQGPSVDCGEGKPRRERSQPGRPSGHRAQAEHDVPARDERGLRAAVEDRQPADPIGMRVSEAEREEAAVVVANDVHGFDVEGVEQLPDPRDLGFVIEAQVQRPLRLTPAEQVRRDQPVLSRERRDLVAPAVVVGGIAVQQQDRLGVRRPRLPAGHPGAIHLERMALGHPRRRGSKGGRIGARLAHGQATPATLVGGMSASPRSPRRASTSLAARSPALTAPSM